MDSATLTNRHTWGVSRHLLVTEKFDLALAEGHAGGASSMHTHRRKHNVFLVLTGMVAIIGADGEPLADLGPHESYTAPANLPHRMVFVTGATLYELYYPTDDNGGIIDLDDIQRLDGGWKPGEAPA